MAFRQNSDGFPNLTTKGSPTISDLVQLADAADSNQVKQATFSTLPFLQLGGGTLTGALVLPGSPSSDLEAATKEYVDTVASGFTVKQACYASSTADLNATYNNGAAGVGATLTHNVNGVFSTDGTSPALNARILVQFQTATKENGIYEVTDQGSVGTPFILTRTTDYDAASEITVGSLVIVNNGTLYATTSWVQTATVTTVGTDPIVFSQFTAGVGANRTLSNLNTTAINQSLIPNAATTFDLGTGANYWQTLYLEQLIPGTSAGNTLTLYAWDVDGATAVPFVTLTSNNTPTCAIASAVTGVTQSASDNSTKLATTAYVDTQVTTTGATKALDNLASVAINTSLLPGVDGTPDLGSVSKRFDSAYVKQIRTNQTAGQTLILQARDVDGASWVDFITLTANNIPTCALSGSVTGVTQAASTNNTTLATTAYVDNATGGGSGANAALSNLASVAINTSLLPASDNAIDVGSAAKRFVNLFATQITTGHTAAQTLDIGAWDVDGATFVPFFTMTANNTPTGVLASAVTATTQAPGDNTTKLATTAFVTTAVGASGGANTALSNLSAVAINTSLLPGSDNAIDLGSATIRWANAYSSTLRTGSGAGNTMILQARDVDGAVWTDFITLTANNTPTCVLASAVTGTTQANGDNSTKLATTAYVDTRVPDPLTLAKGGTSKNLTASNGGIVYTDSDSMEVLAGTATALQMLQSGANAAPAWSTTTWPATTTANRILYSSSTSVIGQITSANSGLLVTDGSGVPSIGTAIPNGVTATTQAANDNSTKVATTAYADAVGTSSGGALVYIATVTASSSASVDFSNNLTSTYDNYLIVIENLAVANNGTFLESRVGTGATPTWQTSNYHGGLSGSKYSTNDTVLTSGQTQYNSATTFMDLTPNFTGCLMSNTSTVAGSGFLYITNVNDATNDKSIVGEMSYTMNGSASGTGHGTMSFGGRWNGATVLTSFRFIQSAGNIASGKFRLYGIKNS